MALRNFADGFEDGSNQAERAAVLCEAIVQSLYGGDSASAEKKEMPPFFGAALMIAPIPEMVSSLTIVVLLNRAQYPEPPPGRPVYLRELPLAYERVRALVPGRPGWLQGIRAVTILEPEIQLAPGDKIQVSIGGSAGCGLAWTGGRGFSMAGHVAPNAGSIVRQSGTQVGTVVWANNPTSGSRSVEADFSVVELSPSVGFYSGHTTHASPNRTTLSVWFVEARPRIPDRSLWGWFRP